MANEHGDDDRTRKEGSFTKESEEVTRDEDGVHTKQRYTKDTSNTDHDNFDDAPRGEQYDDRTDTHAGDADTHPGLLWFSVAGAIIMGALWIIDITGLFGLDWPVLGRMTTLAIAVLAAIGAVLFWYHDRKAKRTTTAT
ncbi:OPT family oligopeptide transporter [Halopelagius longus]|uniref:Uncharacterized protein n=1 Tax=Halopelagius longus TaxID=1236180 RepID=A0A1H1AHH5_9EURY|nr:hypothetical protein [Halopelagius longus]RDI70381.1 hypothetical protein DWB78_00845 [Halopelagius longus]SDQ39115.1 hypothetical protein SAMN05216278_1338 [Halopelagius longus]